jgi:hypothetical protein
MPRGLCQLCGDYIEGFVHRGGPLPYHYDLADKKCKGRVSEAKEAKSPIPPRTGAAADAPAAGGGAKKKAPIMTVGYAWNGENWVGGSVYRTSTSLEPSVRQNAKLTATHTEQLAYAVLGSSHAAATWFAFVQNAPPCTEYCLLYFINMSKANSCNFVFVITDDHAGYCADYAALNDNHEPATPFNLYVYEGKWGFTAPEGAPSLETL